MPFVDEFAVYSPGGAAGFRSDLPVPTARYTEIIVKTSSAAR